MAPERIEEVELGPKEAATRTTWQASTLQRWARQGVIAARRVLVSKRKRGRWLIRLRRSAVSVTEWDVIEL